MTFHFEYEADKQFSFDYEALMKRVMLQVLDYEKCPYEVEINMFSIAVTSSLPSPVFFMIAINYKINGYSTAPNR